MQGMHRRAFFTVLSSALFVRLPSSSLHRILFRSTAALAHLTPEDVQVGPIAFYRR